MIPARLRTDTQWSDACILNISSRGMMIQSARAGPEGSRVELRRDDHVIVARVVWRSGSRFGLRSDERLPIEQIVSLGQVQGLRLVATDGVVLERRKRPRQSYADARTRGRGIEFLGLGIIIFCLSIGAAALVHEALARPFARLEAAFDRRS